jgi:hypothetical protein
VQFPSPPRANEAEPAQVPEGFGKQDFVATIRTAWDAGSNYAGVVQDCQVARLEKIRQISEPGMGDCLGGFVEDHHAGTVPLGERILRDEFLWQVVVIIGKLIHERGMPLAAKDPEDSCLAGSFRVLMSDEI